MNRKELINAIIEKEWIMFQAVNEGGPRASCQNNKPTFIGMRAGQYGAWSDEILTLWYERLTEAENSGRNLIREKYIHMMCVVSPREYELLMQTIPAPSEQEKEAADKICALMIRQTVPLHERYPSVSGAGRPLYSYQDISGVTSIETYQKGELFTYGQKMLDALYAYALELEKEGRSLAEEVLLHTVKYYGYESLDAAEAATGKRNA
ncbi:MAG: DUF4125 family protein [Oscillospiraceae bacterium]|nr:DUF4125 family protein [Oscillospiraceae bacterium]